MAALGQKHGDAALRDDTHACLPVARLARKQHPTTNVCRPVVIRRLTYANHAASQALTHFKRAVLYRAMRWWAFWVAHARDLRARGVALAVATEARMRRAFFEAWLAYTLERQIREAEFTRRQLQLQQVGAA